MAKEKRFLVTHSENASLTIDTKILVDQETGVNYLLVNSGYGAGLTPLLDRTGKPVITAVER